MLEKNPTQVKSVTSMKQGNLLNTIITKEDSYRRGNIHNRELLPFIARNVFLLYA